MAVTPCGGAPAASASTPAAGTPGLSPPDHPPRRCERPTDVSNRSGHLTCQTGAAMSLVFNRRGARAGEGGLDGAPAIHCIHSAMQSGGPAEGQPSLEKGPAPAVGRDLFPALARHQTLEKSAYQDLRRAIVEGRFAPGERIVAASVAASESAASPSCRRSSGSRSTASF